VKRTITSAILRSSLGPRAELQQGTTQPSIPPGSVNEYQLRLGRKKQVWFIPLADESGVCR